jgi:hypothetical protein
MGKAKPFDIPKREVWEAFKRVKANQGAAGVDAQSIADFEVDLLNNLYKLWNRLSSGTVRAGLLRYEPDRKDRVGAVLPSLGQMVRDPGKIRRSAAGFHQAHAREVVAI